MKQKIFYRNENFTDYGLAEFGYSLINNSLLN